MAEHVLYVGAQLPKRSETFVYREVLGLRSRGLRVSVASVHSPERDLGDAALDALAREAEVVYGGGLAGPLRACAGAAGVGWRRPPRGLLEASPTYWPKYAYQAAAGWDLAHRLHGAGITHVHAHMAHVPTTIAMHCADALGVPFSFTGHAADLFRDRMSLRTKLERAGFVACISVWHRAFYREFAPGLDLPDEKLPIIRCGVDTRAFVPRRANRAAAEPQVLSVGRLVAKKGFDLLIRAVAMLRERGRMARATIIGDGPEHATLSSLIASLGLQDQVSLLGAMSNAEVRRRLMEADLFVLPCRVDPRGDRDGIPVVLMEAMASGVPVISGDLPTIRELVVDGETGRLCPPGDPAALSDGMASLLTDPAERERLAANGRRKIEAEFSLDTTLDRLLEAFERIHSRACAPAGGTPAGAGRPNDAG